MRTLSLGVIGYLLLNIFLSCNGEKSSPENEVRESPFSATSIIKAQINHLDTSFYLIVKQETIDGKTDSGFLKREEIRQAAKDFLEIPDISDPALMTLYTEEKLIDESQNVLSITYTAKDTSAEIQQQIFIISLDELASGNVKSVYIDRNLERKDQSVVQRLYWELDNYFSVGEIIQQQNKPEMTRLLKVTWK